MANRDESEKFAVFYTVYPRREARKDAEKAWRQVNGDAHAEAIMAALAWQVPYYLKRERQHRPLPATYLRGERWTDENPVLEAMVTKPDPLHEQFERWRQANWSNPITSTITFEQFRAYADSRRRRA